MKFTKKVFAAAFAASFSLPIYSQVNKGFENKTKIISTSNSEPLVAENPTTDDSGTLKISVTGTRTPREVQNVPASVNIISGDEITERGVQDMRDLFKYDAAVDLKSENEGSFNEYGQGDISIRGFSGNRILMQRDSIRLPAVYRFGSSYTIFRSEMVDFNSLKGTEVLKGAASSLYGSDALGGVVTFQSLFPEDFLEDNENSKYETINTYSSVNDGYSSVFRAAGRDDDSGLEGVLVVTKTSGNEAKVKADQAYINDLTSDGLNLYTNIVKNIDDYSRYNVIIENIDKDNETILKPDNVNSGYSSSKENRNIERTMVSINYEYDNAESDNFFDYTKVGAYIQNAYSEDDSVLRKKATSGRSVVPEHTVTNDYDLKDDSIGANLQFRNDLTKSSTNHRLTYGVDYSKTSNSRSRIKILSDGQTGTTNVKDSPDSDTTLLGIYLQDEISFDKSKWELIPGLRFDYYKMDSEVDSTYLQSSKSENPVDQDKQILNPSLALLYKSNKNITFYGKYNQGFRAPQYSEINTTFGNLAHGYYIVNNPSLKSETSNNFEVGVNGNYDRLNFSLNGFWSNFKDRIDGYEAVSTTSSLYDKGDDGLVQSSSCNPRGGVYFAEGRTCDDITVYQFVNKDKAEVYGLELNANYNFNNEPNGFSLINSLAYTLGNDTSTSTYTPLTSIEPFKAITGIKYDSKNNKWGTELIATYTGVAKTSSSNTNFVPDASTIFDLISYYDVNDRLSFDLGIYNIFDKRYYKYATVKNERSTAADLERFSEPGANVKVGFKFVF